GPMFPFRLSHVPDGHAGRSNVPVSALARPRWSRWALQCSRSGSRTSQTVTIDAPMFPFRLSHLPNGHDRPSNVPVPAPAPLKRSRWKYLTSIIQELQKKKQTANNPVFPIYYI